MSAQRPFSLNREQILNIKQGNIENIVRGERKSAYSEWSLAGELHFKFSPILAVAFSPDISYTGFTPNQLPAEKLLEYRTTVYKLELPERILRLEKERFSYFVQRGDQILNRISPDASLNLLPTAMIVFSQVEESGPQSIHLFCPYVIPPSAALRFVKRNSRFDA